MPQWFYAGRNDVYDVGPYPSLKEAKQRAPLDCKLQTGERVNIGLLEVFHTEVCGQDAVDNLHAAAHDTIGELAENWLVNVPAEQVETLGARLSGVVQEWLEEFGYEPKFGIIESTAEYVLNARGELDEVGPNNVISLAH